MQYQSIQKLSLITSVYVFYRTLKYNKIVNFVRLLMIDGEFRKICTNINVLLFLYQAHCEFYQLEKQ